MLESSDLVFNHVLSSQWFNICLYFVLTTIFVSLNILVIFLLNKNSKLINKIRLDQTIDNQIKVDMIKFYNTKAKILKTYFWINGVIIICTLLKFVLSLIHFKL